MDNASLHPRVFFRRPSQQVIEGFLQVQRRCEFTYQEVGCTRETDVAGFDLDEYRVRLGQGQETFAAACSAMRAWRMFPKRWTGVVHGESDIAAQQTVAVLIKVFGLWWLNSARIVYMLGDTDRRFGFAYGTLPGHVECGEERFMVEWDEDDVVWYELRAMSRPRLWFTRLGYPFVRRLQRLFGRDSQQSMTAAIAEHNTRARSRRGCR